MAQGISFVLTWYMVVDMEFYSGHVACNSVLGVRGDEVVDLKFYSGHVACNSAFVLGIESCRHGVLFCSSFM